MAIDVVKGESEFKAAFDAGKTVQPVHQLPGVPDLSVVVVKDGYRVEKVDGLQALLPTPRRKAATVTLYTPESFVDYVQAFGDQHTLITADVAETRLDAWLDYHQAGEGTPRWREHKAHYVVRKTKEWLLWNEASGKAKSQFDFAVFLEDNLPDIATPPGGELLALVKHLQIKNDVRFSGKVNPSDGSKQLLYQETIQGNDVNGDVRIPDEFVLGLQPFEGSDRFQVTARLRYRVESGGALKLWVDLLRPHKVLEEAFDDIVAAVKAQLDGKRLIHGKVG